jgi:DNA-nicking Smr family endonuclease
MSSRIDLHGLTKDEALSEVDRQVNHAFIQDSDDRRVFFITGWGMILRPAVKAFLQDHPLVKEIRVEGPKIQALLEEL